MSEVWDLTSDVLGCQAVRTVFLWGPPGIGKTHAAYNAPRDGRVPDVYAVTLTQETPAAELRGHFVPRGQEYVWHDGPFVRAMRQGARLVVNEITHAAPDVLAILYPVLESEQTAMLMLPSRETVRPAPGFHVICTDNESPTALPPALRDRFDATIRVGEPHPDAFGGLRDHLAEAARRTVALPDGDSVSIRRWHAVERLLRSGWTEDRALSAVFGVEQGGEVSDAMRLAAS